MSDGNFFSPFSRLLSSFLSFLFFDPPRRLNIESSITIRETFYEISRELCESLRRQRNFLFFLNWRLKYSRRDLNSIQIRKILVITSERNALSFISIRLSVLDISWCKDKGKFQSFVIFLLLETLAPTLSQRSGKWRTRLLEKRSTHFQENMWVNESLAHS